MLVCKLKQLQVLSAKPSGAKIGISPVTPKQAWNQLAKLEKNFNPGLTFIFLSLKTHLCIKSYSICCIFILSAQFCFISVYLHLFF